MSMIPTILLGIVCMLLTVHSHRQHKALILLATAAEHQSNQILSLAYGLDALAESMEDEE